MTENTNTGSNSNTAPGPGADSSPDPSISATPGPGLAADASAAIIAGPNSQSLFARAQALLPGGVNSPVRAFKAVGGNPLFIDSAQGAYVFDADANQYLDYVGSWGPMILGHNHPNILVAVAEAVSRGLSFGAPNENEVLLAEKIKSFVPSLEMLRMVNSGTEAVISALRLARGYSGRDKIIKFAGCYHGHADSMLVKAGSGALTTGEPDSLGVPVAVAADTLTANYNDLASVETLLSSYPVAAIIVEPVAANMGVVLPAPGFLPGLRTLADKYGSLLIFDEVITGFRLAKGGAQEFYGVQADLVTYGKIIGGGMPVGAYGGRREIMQLVSPSGAVYQAGTLSGNPVAMAAGLAQLSALEDSSLYLDINAAGQHLAEGMRQTVAELGLKATVNQVGSLVSLFFAIDRAEDYASVLQANTDQFGRYFRAMLAAGIYLAPSQFEAMFVSAAHSSDDIEQTLNTGRAVLTNLKAEGLI